MKFMKGGIAGIEEELRSEWEQRFHQVIEKRFPEGEGSGK